MRFRAYRNLHCKAVRWSLLNEQTGIVVAHVSGAILTDVNFVVSQTARQRMIEVLKKRWVVGWVLGNVVAVQEARPGGKNPDRETATYEQLIANASGEFDQLAAQCTTQLRFNPWQSPAFVRQDNSEPVYKAELVLVGTNGACWAKLTA